MSARFMWPCHSLSQRREGEKEGNFTQHIIPSMLTELKNIIQSSWFRGTREVSRLVAGRKTTTRALEGKKNTFNVANTLDGDTRANPYRYVLTAQYAKPPLNVEKYTEADYLYIVSNLSQNELLDDKRWELASFPVMETTELGMINQEIRVFRWKNGSADRKDLVK